MDVLSLCSGIGMLDLGVKLAVPRSRTVCYVEREVSAASILVARMGNQALDPAPVWSDLETFDGRPWRGLVDCVIGGFPCQPFSAAGSRRGLEDERWLWPHIQRVVADVEPSLCFFENVPGLTKHGLGVVLGDLARLGFNAEWGVLGADDVGAPHRRKRLWILGLLQHDGREKLRQALDLDGDHASGDESDGRDPGVADTESLPLWVQPEWQQFDTSERGDSEPGHDRTELADAHNVRRNGRARSFGERGGSKSADGSARLFPLPLGDERWRDVEADAQPALRRGPDGRPEGLDSDLTVADRLRALGNGVVPLAAAHAFRTLARRALT